MPMITQPWPADIGGCYVSRYAEAPSAQESASAIAPPSPHLLAHGTLSMQHAQQRRHELLSLEEIWTGAERISHLDGGWVDAAQMWTDVPASR